MIALRSFVFAVITISLTVLAHAGAGGTVPSPVAVAILVLITAAVGAPLFRRRWRPLLLVPAVGGAQVVLHPVFEGLAGMAATGHTGHGSTLGMLGAHVVAGVLAVLLVTALDPAVRCLGSRGSSLMIRLGVVRVAPVTEPRAVPVGHDLVLTPRVMARPAPRRGPPVPARPAAV